MFEDKRCAPYSIHQIALMGVSYGKQVGEWFGPNTIAQVLKWVYIWLTNYIFQIFTCECHLLCRKLATQDKLSSLVFHVALDNTLVINEVSKYTFTILRLWNYISIVYLYLW